MFLRLGTDSKVRHKESHIFAVFVPELEQEPVTRSVELHHIPVTAFSQTDLSSVFRPP